LCPCHSLQLFWQEEKNKIENIVKTIESTAAMIAASKTLSATVALRAA